MTLNPWSRRSIVAVMASMAITVVLAGSSSSRDDADEQLGATPEKQKAVAQPEAQTLTITINSAENGQVSSLKVGLAKLFDGPLDGHRLKMLDRRLKDVFAISKGKPFDRLLLRVDQRLNSGDLINVINVCESQEVAEGGPVKKMNFVVLK